CVLISFQSPLDHRLLHSFPTRRSSDLIQRALQGNSFFANADLFDSVGIWNPTAGGLKKADLTAGLVKLNTNGHFALGSSTTAHLDRKSTRLNSSHRTISYAVFCLKKKK